MEHRILVVDDDKQVVQLLRSYLEEVGFQVFTAHDGETALHILRRERPHLVVLDLMLPKRDGWDITRLILADSSLKQTGIVMLTARVEDIDRILGLEMGADDYVMKPFNPREVVARVRTVLRRIHQPGSVAVDEFLTCGTLRLNPVSHEVYAGDTLLMLTPTEFKLLYLFISNSNRVFTRAELIEKVFGYEYDTADRVLDSHIRNLRKKIAVNDDTADPIQTLYGVGYRLVEV
ncbi:MAG: response regulator transcription factor [Anaerolineae bacterium]